MNHIPTPRFTSSEERIHVLEGEARASADPNVVFTTVLGSCVALCLFDPQARIGGMNHFLLSEPPSSHVRGEIDVHYGVYLMEILVNAMLAQGAARSRMKAHLYGGANLRSGLAAIGTANANFARSFLDQERIALVRSDLEGGAARRVEFRPASGHVRCRIVQTTPPAVLPSTTKPGSGVAQQHRGDVELF